MAVFGIGLSGRLDRGSAPEASLDGIVIEAFRGSLALAASFVGLSAVAVVGSFFEILTGFMGLSGPDSISSARLTHIHKREPKANPPVYIAPASKMQSHHSAVVHDQQARPAFGGLGCEIM
jgi:hypothetical protein